MKGILLLVMAFYEVIKICVPKPTARVKGLIKLHNENPVLDVSGMQGAVQVLPGQKVVRDGQVVMHMPYTKEMCILITIDLVYTVMLLILLFCGLPCLLGAVTIMLLSPFSGKLPPAVWAVRFDSILTLGVLLATMHAVGVLVP